jgi:hypothetical protein
MRAPMSDDDFANRFLEKGRERYEAGDRSELLYCLYWCVSGGRPIPHWLCVAFTQTFLMADELHEVKSWDDVFGKPLKKGKRLGTERKKADIMRQLFQHINELHDEEGKALDGLLFAAVGKKYGVGATVAAEIYYAAQKRLLADEDDIINRKNRDLPGRLRKSRKSSGKMKKQARI